MKKEKLSKEEMQIEASLESWKARPKSEVIAGIKAAKVGVAARRKEARVNIRMSAADLELVKERADREGLGYQTWLSSIIHKSVTGQLVDRSLVDDFFEKSLPKKKKKSAA